MNVSRRVLNYVYVCTVYVDNNVHVQLQSHSLKLSILSVAPRCACLHTRRKHRLVRIEFCRVGVKVTDEGEGEGEG